MARVKDSTRGLAGSGPNSSPGQSPAAQDHPRCYPRRGSHSPGPNGWPFPQRNHPFSSSPGGVLVVSRLALHPLVMASPISDPTTAVRNLDLSRSPGTLCRSDIRRRVSEGLTATFSCLHLATGQAIGPASAWRAQQKSIPDGARKRAWLPATQEQPAPGSIVRLL